jgi:cell wall-associated NlpC family hydrolase
VEKKLLVKVDDSLKTNHYVATQWHRVINAVSNESVWLGSSLWINCELEDYLKESFKKHVLNNIVIDLINYAKLYLGTSYLWGGRSPAGIDCSGFVQMVFKLMGIAMPRDAFQQAENGMLITELNKSKAGDLAFFINEKEKITHVGIIIDNKTIIHASGWVKIEKLTDKGIINNKNELTHQLFIIKRLHNFV